MKNFVKVFKNIIILLVVVFPLIVGAAAGEGVDSGLNPLGSVSSLWELLSRAFNVLIEIGIPIAGLALVYSGFLFVSAMGDEKQLTSAKETLKWTVIGLGVLLGAEAIILVVQETIGGL